MKVAIIALILAIAALGFSGFATFTSLNNDEATPVAESGWSASGCKSAEWSVGVDGPLFSNCIRFDHDCAPYNDMLQAIAANCP